MQHQKVYVTNITLLHSQALCERCCKGCAAQKDQGGPITFRASTGAHPASELIALLEDARCADRADHAKVRCLAFGQSRPELGLSRAEGMASW